MAPFPAQLTSGRKIGIALGSGSARGLAHIGILDALQQWGVRPTVVCGTSIGALVGACYATGHLDSFARWVGDLSTSEIWRFLNLQLRGGGMANASRLMSHLRSAYGEPDIEQLDCAFAAVTTDLHRGREIWLQQGSIWSAVRASIAIPGILTPVQHGDRWLVDGGLVNPIPVSVCRALGADIVIAVNLNSDLVGRRRQDEPELPPLQPDDTAESTLAEAPSEAGEADHSGLLGRIGSSLWEATEPMRYLWNGEDETPASPGTLEVMLSAINIMQDRITRSRLAGDPADVILAPRLGDVGLLEFSRSQEAIAEGRATVERMLSALEHALERG